MSTRILIVDDEFGLADIVAEILKDRGYQTTLAINGKLGLEALVRESFALVLMDVMMPVLDGAETLRAMRQQEKLRSIPVVMMTALREALPKDDPPLFQAVLYKPFTEDQLFAAIGPLIPPGE